MQMHVGRNRVKRGDLDVHFLELICVGREQLYEVTVSREQGYSPREV